MEPLGGIGGYSGGMAGLFGMAQISRSPGKEEREQSQAAGRVPGRTEDKNSGGILNDLSQQEEQKVQDLKRRDQEVKTHEQAHMAASGSVAVSGPNYQYEKGPDGQMYAVEGNVQIDTSEAENPEATLAKARQIKAAATAPSQPSGADRKVAAKAAQMESEARREISDEKVEDEDGADNKPGVKAAGNKDEQSVKMEAEQEPAAWEMRRASLAYEQSTNAAMEGKVFLRGLSLAV